MPSRPSVRAAMPPPPQCTQIANRPSAAAVVDGRGHLDLGRDVARARTDRRRRARPRPRGRALRRRRRARPRRPPRAAAARSPRRVPMRRPLRARRCRRFPQLVSLVRDAVDERPLARADHVLDVAQVRHLADLLARRDCGCRSARRRSGASRTRASRTAPPRAAAHRLELVDRRPTTRCCTTRRRARRRRRGSRSRSASGIAAPVVEHALRRRVARVDALARDAVVLGRVPRDERLPHVVVREVAVLVVRRVEVREVERAERRRPASTRRRARAAPGPATSSGTRSVESAGTSAAPTA